MSPAVWQKSDAFVLSASNAALISSRMNRLSSPYSNRDRGERTD